jgi:hypothetical protein
MAISEWDKWFAGDEEFETRRNSLEFAEIRINYEWAKLFVEKWWNENCETVS